LAFGYKFHRPNSETSGKQPIRAGGRAAALQMPEEHTAGFSSGRRFERRRQLRADASEPFGIRGGFRLKHGVPPTNRQRTLSAHHDAESGAKPFPPENVLRND